MVIELQKQGKKYNVSNMLKQGKVWQLKRTIYGLRQAAFEWQKTLMISSKNASKGGTIKQIEPK
jgi:hypothetical protein